MRALIVLILCCSARSFADDEAPGPVTPERITAPVVYDGLALVFTTKDSVAAVAFGKQIDEGVTYRYRLRAMDDDEIRSGEGKVFEKYDRVPTDGPHGEKVTGIVDRGSELFIKAGSIKVEWSYSAKGRGWIYYRPEEVQVQMANAKDFEKLDLKRFAK